MGSITNVELKMMVTAKAPDKAMIDTGIFNNQQAVFIIRNLLELEPFFKIPLIIKFIKIIDSRVNC